MPKGKKEQLKEKAKGELKQEKESKKTKVAKGAKETREVKETKEAKETKAKATDKATEEQALKEEATSAKAGANYLRVSPRKARAVVDLIRGKDLEEALMVLKFCPRKAAGLVEKIVSSAAANAERNLALSRDSLYVASAYVNQGPTAKRFRHRAMGRASRIRKRTSHVTVVLGQKEA